MRWTECAVRFRLRYHGHRTVDRLYTAYAAAPWILISLLVVYIYVYGLGDIPYGFFCDEAEIGLESQKLVSQYLLRGRFPLFYDHFEFVSGALPLYATAPFVFVLGLSEFSVRLSSSLFMLAGFLILYWSIKKRLGAGSAKLVVLLFALTPTVIHVARINFGHSPSILFMLLGFTLFSTAREKNNLFLSALGGLCLGMSTYGYPGYYVAAPLFILCLCATELFFNRRAFERYKPALALLIVAGMCYVPIVYTAFHNPGFWTRWSLKSPGDTSVVDAVTRILQNYPKYYGFAYLFSTGEINPPDEPITRHSVCDSGLLLTVTLPLLMAGLLRFLSKFRNEEQRFFFPFYVLLFLYPVPDVLTTRNGYPPYTFSVFTNILFVPYIAAYGIEVIHDFNASHIWKFDWCQIFSRYLLTPLLTIVILSSGIYYYVVTYKQYPLIASDFWGWQSGPKEMINYFLRHAIEYDEFYMEYAFNQPRTFFEFHIRDPLLRQKTHIGGLGKLDPSKRQLFGVSRAVFDRISAERSLEVKHIVKYPNGSDAFYLVVNDIEGLKRTYSPIESAEEALRYALAATPYRPYYDGFPVSHPYAGAKVRYLTDRIEATHVDTVDGGYIVYLFDFEELGCSPWSFYSVPVRVNQDGTIAVSDKTVLYQFDTDDPLTTSIREVTCAVE